MLSEMSYFPLLLVVQLCNSTLGNSSSSLFPGSCSHLSHPITLSFSPRSYQYISYKGQKITLLTFTDDTLAPLNMSYIAEKKRYCMVGSTPTFDSWPEVFSRSHFLLSLYILVSNPIKAQKFSFKRGEYIL